MPEPTPSHSSDRPASWRKRAWLASVAGALGLILAFPTIGLSPFALIALAPALVVSRRQPWRRRLKTGWLLGIIAQLVLFRWITFTMDVMTNLPEVAGVGLLVAFALWHGLQFGVFFALAEPVRRAAVRQAPWAGPLAVAATWAAIEWSWPMVFPWGLGHALWEVGPIVSLAAFTGVAGLSFLVALVNAVVAERWIEGNLRTARVAMGTVVVLMGLGLSWFLLIHNTTPDRILRVAVVQPNYPLEEKRGADVDQRLIFLDRFEAQLGSLEAGRYDLVVASEGAYPMWWALDADRFPGGLDPSGLPRDAAATRRIQRAVAQGPAAFTIMGGLRNAETGRLRNALVAIAPDGRIAGHYDKQTLVPFGEYLPGADWFPALRHKVRGIGNMEAGALPCVFEGPVEIACGVCYEHLFADQIRRDVADARILVNATIDTWFGKSTAPWFHLMSHASRAVEMGVPLVRAALTGISAVVGADGQVIDFIPLDEAGVLSVDVPITDLVTPYRVVGPLFAWLCALAVFLLLGLSLRSRGELFVADGVDERGASS